MLYQNDKKKFLLHFYSDVSHNKIMCNCSLSWVTNSTVNIELIGKCDGPPSLYGRNISSVSHSEMCREYCDCFFFLSFKQKYLTLHICRATLQLKCPKWKIRLAIFYSLTKYSSRCIQYILSMNTVQTVDELLLTQMTAERLHCNATYAS